MHLRLQLKPRLAMAREELPWFGVPWPHLNEGIFYTDVVPPSFPPCTLLEFYTSKHKDSAPRKGWLQRIQNGQITVDGSITIASDAIIRSGTKLVYHRRPWNEPLCPFKLQVLYEDESILAVNKPSGLQVLPGGAFQQRTVLTQLKWRSNELKLKEGALCLRDSCFLQPSPVHRLGRGTSGILLCAKTQVAKSNLAADFAAGTAANSGGCIIKRHISKKYRALASGILDDDEIFITQPIGRVPYPGVLEGLYVASSKGKPSKSNVRVLSRNTEKKCTLVEVQIFSGRPHQIRIHLAYVGHPLVGDPLYKAGGQPQADSFVEGLKNCRVEENFADDGGYRKPASAVPGDCGYLLHAHRISFCHPITDKMMEIVAKPPPILCTPLEMDISEECSFDCPWS